MKSRSWRACWPSWRPSCAKFGRLGASWADLGSIFGHLKGSSGDLGRSWCDLWSDAEHGPRRMSGVPGPRGGVRGGVLLVCWVLDGCLLCVVCCVYGYRKT